MDPRDLDPDPVTQFLAWYAEAGAAGEVCLATAAADGGPDARMVLLKGVDGRGFVFYTNESSAKGRQLAENPRAALVFHWSPRQVRVRGSVVEVGDGEADAYWGTRPRGAQLGAWASQQSSALGSRDELDARLAEVAARYPGDVPRPPYWTGYRVVPDEVEFWLHRDDRLHDRVLYRRADGSWSRERLSP
jgi:pyridoxamine 5'-phosphate oxidase